MSKMSVAAIALAAALGVGTPFSGAFAAEKLSPQEAYDKALTDCEQRDNPDRRQQCREQAKQQFEQAQKYGTTGGMEKQKQRQY